MTDVRLSKADPHADRPECMVTLGLMPPYTAQDVKEAYLAKIKELRPEGDVDQAEFDRIQQAYEQAQAYVEFRGDRRGWIARRLEDYVAVEQVVEQLKSFGADVETSALDWLEKSFGDFAELTESIVGIRLAGAANANDVIGMMVGQHERLLELRRLELPGCQVSDESVQHLSVFRRLSHLDLSHTPITVHALRVVERLPELESLSIDGTRIKWWARRRMEARMRRKRKAAAIARALHPTRVR